MRHFGKNIRRFQMSENGPTAVEYAVMLALIVIVCLGAIRTSGVYTANTFRQAANSVGS
jgi:pilus assembly protein Flp/PilA